MSGSGQTRHLRPEPTQSKAGPFFAPTISAGDIAPPRGNPKKRTFPQIILASELFEIRHPAHKEIG